jgi:tripartite-type tricarboxylate transporter receptor subunit TctC
MERTRIQRIVERLQRSRVAANNYIRIGRKQKRQGNRSSVGRQCLFAVVMLMPAASYVHSEPWPSRPIRMVVSFPPGSSPDVIARAVGTSLAQSLQQPVVVENRPGAGGLIGASVVAKAPADGYTLLMSSGSTMAIAPHVVRTMPFDPKKDLVPVAAGARIELFLLVRNDLPVADFKGFIEYAKTKPGRLSYASPGIGTAPHVAVEMLKAAAGIDAVHVPYKGSPAALQDLLSGQVDFVFDPGVGLAQVRAGKLRLLAVGSTRRSRQFPDTPTLDELGLKGFDAGTTHTFYAPAGTPQAVIDRVNSSVNTSLQLPNTQEAIRAIGAEPTPMPVKELMQVVNADFERYRAMVTSAKITGD